MNPELQAQFRSVTNAPFVAGWGMTETGGPASNQDISEDGQFDMLGAPMLSYEFKLLSHNEYDATASEIPR